MKFIATILSLTLSLTAFEVLTITDAVIDHIAYVDEAFVEEMPGEKGGTDFIDVDSFESLIAKAGGECRKMPGGSAANMAKGLAECGHHCGVIGYIGEDEAGEYFANSLTQKGVTPLLYKSEGATGRIGCFITPDKARTMRSCRGAADNIASYSFEPHLFNNLRLFHLEGYKLHHERIVREATKLARDASALVSMDVASFEIAGRHRELIWELITSGAIDLLFMNEKEAEVLTGLAPGQAAHHFADFCKVAVVTMGKEGGFVASDKGVFKYDAQPSDPVDETGAGDLFMSGFLHGYLTGSPLEICAEIGAKLAARIVETVGAELPSLEYATRGN